MPSGDRRTAVAFTRAILLIAAFGQQSMTGPGCGLTLQIVFDPQAALCAACSARLLCSRRPLLLTPPFSLALLPKTVPRAELMMWKMSPMPPGQLFCPTCCARAQANTQSAVEYGIDSDGMCVCRMDIIVLGAGGTQSCDVKWGAKILCLFGKLNFIPKPSQRLLDLKLLQAAGGCRACQGLLAR